MKSTPVEIVILHAPWRRSLKDAAKLGRQAARAALAGAGQKAERRSIAIALGDDELLQALNHRYRGKDKPTNVLSFEAGAPDRLGDIALSLPTLKREAKEQGKTLQAHFRHLVVHGTLHLLGFDHEKPRLAERMEALERQILAGLGVADPYDIADRNSDSSPPKKSPRSKR
ncbi:MAG: ybeY [Alphaproteobacteria bacterium]|jgi:probable rRNA maturation factor|nr:ybeY [Alphaproteobacteria bacterium]